MLLRIGTVFLLLLVGCAPLVQRDLRKEYFAQTRAIGMTPVYPPRGEVQVGDVFLVFVPAGGNEDAAKSLWVGRMTSVRDQARAYLASRDNVGALMPSGNTATQFGEMTELPAVNFPTITGSAASSVSLGAISPAFSGLFAFASSDSVSMKFVDVRAFGVPFLSASLSEPDFRHNVCAVLEQRLNSMYRQLGHDPDDTANPSPCGAADAALSGQSCRLHVVTRTYLTRQIQFSYNLRRRVGGSAAVASPLPAATPVASVPAVSVNIDANTAPDTANSVITALKTPATATVSSVAATAASETAQGFAFDQSFKDPLTIAYESMSIAVGDAANICFP